jgi:hypothetical protein
MVSQVLQFQREGLALPSASAVTIIVRAFCMRQTLMVHSAAKATQEPGRFPKRKENAENWCKRGVRLNVPMIFERRGARRFLRAPHPTESRTER